MAEEHPGVNNKKKKGKHQCDQCDKSFNRLRDLKEHGYTHSGDYPYHCEMCNKGFARKKDIDGHMLIHSGEKPHQCSKCGKRCTHRGQVNGHLLIHSEEKRFQCEICGKKFRWKDDVKRHSWIHSDQKPYECTLCHKSFTWAGDFSKHMQIHGVQKPYSGIVCGKEFMKEGNLRTHTKEHKHKTEVRSTFVKRKNCDEDSNSESFVLTEIDHQADSPMCKATNNSNQTRQKKNKTIKSSQVEMQHTNNRNKSTQEVVTSLSTNIQNPGPNRILATSISTHTGKNFYLCTMCNKAFPTVTTLGNYLLSHCELSSLTCFFL